MIDFKSIEQKAKDKGLGRVALCKKAGICPSTYTRWKSGKSKPLLQTYKRILAVIDTPAKPEKKEGE